MKKRFFISLAFVTTLLMSLGLSSCSSDDDPKYPDVTINAGETKELAEGKDLEWKSENEYIATVSNGQIHAGKVGKVKMVSEDGAFSVNVTPKYTYYDEPYIQFGASEKSVKNAMKDYFYINDYNGLLYKKREDTTLIKYYFEDSKLKYSYLYTPIANKRRLVNWLNERYIYLGEENGIAVYMSVDLKTLIGLSTAKDNDGNQYSVAIYMENGYNSNAKSFNFGNAAAQKSNNTECLKVFNDMLKKAAK